jgi:hypothetical protein
MPDVTQSSKIKLLFGSQPRDGTQEGTLWHRRAKIEKRLSQLLSARSQNVCIDGPTGSGKSSLAFTVLSKIKQRYVLVPVVNNMSWSDFCEEIAIKSLNAKFESASVGRRSISVEIDSRKPVSGGELLSPRRLLDRLTIGSKDTDEHVTTLRKNAREWKIVDVENFIETTEHCLLIDDFEKAPEPLVQSVADLCKRLTIRAALKCIIIGTGETFARLYRADEGLDGRLAELSVASFGSQLEVWNYLNDGFARLGFDTPRAMFKSKLIPKADVDRLEKVFYEAADGMPKYINELALRICERVLGEENVASQRVRVSLSSALLEAEQMLQENLSRCNQQIRGVEKELRNSLELRLVLKSIFRLGANGVHSVADIVKFIEQNIDPSFSYDQFTSGLDQLKKLGLYVQTGKSGEVVFAKEPMFSHVLGLICDDPPRFRKDNNVFGLFGQRSLPLSAG